MAVITISRQYGSEGDEIAANLCQILGYQSFNKQLMMKVAAEVGLTEGEVVDFTEDQHRVRSFLDRLLGNPAPVLAQSRSGTLAEFQAMVVACNAAGVDIIADAVINHMTGPGDNNITYTGTAGTPYRGFQYPYPGETLYGPGDFHANVGACSSSSGEIQNYGDRRQVQNCELSGLSDLNTGSAAVQADIRAYLQSLLDMGVKGFRIDGAKHIAANDLAAILNGLTGSFYLFQEVIDVAVILNALRSVRG